MAAVLHQQQRDDDGHERDGVDGVDKADVDVANQQTRQRRANDGGGGEHQRLHAHGIAEVLPGNQVGDERLPRRPLQGVHGRQRAGDQIDVDDGRPARDGQDGQDGSDDDVEPLGKEE